VLALRREASRSLPNALGVLGYQRVYDDSSIDSMRRHPCVSRAGGRLFAAQLGIRMVRPYTRAKARSVDGNPGNGRSAAGRGISRRAFVLAVFRGPTFIYEFMNDAYLKA
jgi:hypothetical protein